MPIVDRDLRVLVCTANLGNARPDEASIAALIPDDGSFSDVVDNPKFPIPTPEEQQSFMDDIGFKTVLRKINGVLDTMSDTSETVWARDNHFDIIVLGFQEATFDVDANDPMIRAVQPLFRKTVGKAVQQGAGLIKSRDYTKHKSDTLSDWLESSDSRLLGSLLQARCPSYNFTVRYQRGEMRLEILTRKGLDVELLSLTAQNTGIGVSGIMNAANKGGIVAELRVEKSTRLTFCTAHLQAHEGREKYEDRCRMTSAILEGTAPDGPLTVDLALRSHFTFFLGDLNFRTELPECADSSKEDHIQQVQQLVAQEKWRELNLADELFKALRDKACLVGFKTLPCFFPPTFKVERNNGLDFKDQRRPSYTDRILWRNMHKLDGRITPLAYEPVIEFSTSDHKPVRGAFKIRLNDIIQPRPPVERKRMTLSTRELFSRSTRRLGGTDDSKLHLFFSNIKCNFRKRAMAPDPIIVFMSFPYLLVQQKVKKFATLMNWLSLDSELSETKKKKRKDGSGFPRTKKLRSTYTPEWIDEIDFVIATHDKNGKPLDLSGAVMFLVVVDKAPTIEDKIIGILPLNLAHLAMSTSVRPPSTMLTKSKWSSLRDVFARSHEVPLAHQIPEISDDNRLLNMKQPLLKFGKETGWISMTLDSKWLSDHEVTAERALRGSTGLLPKSFRTRRESVFRRLQVVEETAEVRPSSSHGDSIGL